MDCSVGTRSRFWVGVTDSQDQKRHDGAEDEA